MKRARSHGFTIVELVVIIAVIGILAGISVIGYNGWQQRNGNDELKSNLLSVANLMKQSKNFGGGYPATFPNEASTTANVVLEMTGSGGSSYCINGYHKATGASQSVRSGSDSSTRSGLCDTPPNGSTLGGTVPAPPKGVNIAPSFDSWTLTGTASYDRSTGELIMGANGRATSPLIRVNDATGSRLNAEFYATQQSANTSLQPDGGWHSGTQYFAGDATTSQANTGGHTGNGCARKAGLSGWASSKGGACTFALGNGVTFTRLILYGAANSYSSQDLKIRAPSFILN